MNTSKINIIKTIIQQGDTMRKSNGISIEEYDIWCKNTLEFVKANFKKEIYEDSFRNAIKFEKAGRHKTAIYTISSFLQNLEVENDELSSIDANLLIPFNKSETKLIKKPNIALSKKISRIFARSVSVLLIILIGITFVCILDKVFPSISKFEDNNKWLIAFATLVITIIGRSILEIPDMVRKIDSKSEERINYWIHNIIKYLQKKQDVD